MRKAKRTLTLLATIMGAAGVWTTTSTAALVPRGTLSAAEYQQLSHGMTALNRSVSAKSINWRKARAACRSVGAGTQLLKSQRASCLANIAVLDSLASFPAEEHACRAAPTTPATTTTGTTTDSTGSNAAGTAVIQLMICMHPHYQALARYAVTLAKGVSAARAEALARGFGGACLAALSPTPADLKRAERFASSTGRLASDVSLLIKVTEGKAPSSDFNEARVADDVRQFESSATAVLDEHEQADLSVCPHQ